MASKSLHLPEDMEVEILSRLPDKSLLRFKSVCKSWYNRINDPTFVAMHLANSMRNPCLLLKSLSVIKDKETGNTSNVISFSLLSFLNGDPNYTNSVVEDISIPLGTDVVDLFFVGHCDGIICLCYYEKILLWNRTTRKCKLVSRAPYHPHPETTKEFDTALAFGYDAKSGDYKVVKVSHSGKEIYADLRLVIHPPIVDVYTLRSDSWRQIELGRCLQTETTYFWPVPVQRMFFKGVCYWTGHEQQKEFRSVYDEYDEPYIRDVIISFDVDHEVFHTILLPDSCYDPNSKVYRFDLVLWKESIALYVVVLESFENEIWVMDEDLGGGGKASSWTKHLTFERIDARSCIFGFWNNYEILFYSMDDGPLASYNVSTKEVRYLPVHITERVLSVGYYRYDQTLYLPSPITESLDYYTQRRTHIWGWVVS